MLPILIASAWLLAPTGTQNEATFDSEYRAAQLALVADLEAFAEWCGRQKLYLERDKAWEAMLAFDADHDGARRGLKHVKKGDGTWVPPAKKVEAKNYNPGALDECARRRGEIAETFRARAFDALRLFHKTPQPALERRIHEDVLRVDAEHVQAREALGEVRVDGIWLLRETADAKARRGELESRIQAAIAAVPALQAAEPDERELSIGVAWTSAFATPRVRVLSTGPADEARKVATMCHAAIDVFHDVTGAPAELLSGYTIYLLVDARSKEAFFAKWPGWTDVERKALSGFAGSGLPREIHVARWDADAPRRLDGAVRHTLGLATKLHFQFDHRDAAWAWEGIGLYLTRELVGTRFTWYGTAADQTDPQAKELLGKLMMADVNWMNEAYQLAKRGRAPALARLLERPIDKMGVPEVLTSYAFAAYLLEGRAQDVGPLLAAIGRREPSADAVSAALGIDLERLDARLVRWLGERR
jgi:hypothetical protein